MNSKMVFTAAGDALITRKIPDRYEGKCQGRVQFDPFGRLKVTQ